jgi:MYXO-CTERM domain-containing protein
MRHMQSSVVALFASVAAATSASAELVTVFCPGVGAGRNVAVQHNGTDRSVFAGQIRLDLTNSTSGTLNGQWRSFCTELHQHIFVNGAPQVYTVSQLKDVPVPGLPMGQVRADAIARMYAFASGAQYGSNADYAAAFQIAVWEIANDYDGTAVSLDLALGNFRGTTLAAAITTSVTTLLGAATQVGAPITQLLGLGNATYQDQIIDPTSPIPTPGTIAMLALAGIFGARRRRRS